MLWSGPNCSSCCCGQVLWQEKHAALLVRWMLAWFRWQLLHSAVLASMRSEREWMKCTRTKMGPSSSKLSGAWQPLQAAVKRGLMSLW